MHPNLKEGKGNNNNKALFAIFYIFYMQVHFMLNRNVFWHWITGIVHKFTKFNMEIVSLQLLIIIEF